ncbi:MAG: hypothetical protein V1748_04505 [Actinomycetota bacterium]
MKVLLVLLDGIADRSQATLGGTTPLQAAALPNLDMLTGSAACGHVYPLGPGVCPSLDLSRWHQLGYGARPYPGRAAIDALGAGVVLDPDDVVVHVSLAATMIDAGERYVQASPAKLPDNQAAEIASALAAYIPEHFPATVHHLGGPFMALVLRGGANPLVSDSDPVFFRNPVPGIVAIDGAPEAASLTARECERFSRWAAETITGHPVIRRREADGMTSPNYVLMKWASIPPDVPTMREEWGFTGALVSDDVFHAGLACALGMTFIDEHAPDVADDLGAKLAAALDCLREEQDLAVIGWAAAAEASHSGKPDRKVRVCEEMDQAFEPFTRTMLCEPDLLTVITAGYAAPSGGSDEVLNSGDSVPVIALGGNARVDGVDAFDEVSCATGSLGCLRASDCMPLLLNISDRARMGSMRVGHRDLPYR